MKTKVVQNIKTFIHSWFPAKNKRHLDRLERHLDGFRSQINVADAEPGGIMVK